MEITVLVTYIGRTGQIKIGGTSLEHGEPYELPVSTVERYPDLFRRNYRRERQPVSILDRQPPKVKKTKTKTKPSPKKKAGKG